MPPTTSIQARSALVAKKTQQDIQNVDKRLVDRLVTRGDFSKDDLDGALNKLPDLEDAAEDISSRVYGAASGDGE